MLKVIKNLFLLGADLKGGCLYVIFKTESDGFSLQFISMEFGKEKGKLCITRKKSKRKMEGINKVI